MGRENRADALDNVSPIGLEGVCRIIEAMLEKNSHEGIGKPIDEELERRVIDDATALHKSAPKHAVVSFV